VTSESDHESPRRNPPVPAGRAPLSYPYPCRNKRGRLILSRGPPGGVPGSGPRHLPATGTMVARPAGSAGMTAGRTAGEAR
jgi:hypothetical protein